MMRFFSLLLGLILLAVPLTALALPAPPLPPVIAPYAREVLARTDANLRTATSSGPQSPCVPRESQAVAARQLAEVLLHPDALREAERDIERSACFRSDAGALERYLSDLVDLALQSAATCDNEALSHYQVAVRLVWERLFDLRRFALDPRTQAPLGDAVTDIPPSAISQSDDALCPYTGALAESTIGGLGCQPSDLPPSSSRRLREARLFERIVWLMGLRPVDTGEDAGRKGLALHLSMAQNALGQLWNDAAAFVKTVSLRADRLGPPVFSLPSLIPFLPLNAGEAGCLGWPSGLGSGIITGADVPRHRSSSLVLTRELVEEVFAYVQEQGAEPGFSYFTVPATGQDFSYRTDLLQEHLRRETSAVLTHIDPQQRMAQSADRLHERTRAFAGLAVHLPGSNASRLPPIRDIAQRYAAFLARICVNRGCGSALKRAMELSLRDECFSSFLMDAFFRANPSARTLPLCRSLYTP